jgi:Fe2+ or Zn2+ uptake regulation protein
MSNEKKMRNTSQRQLILKVVNESLDHPNAETIYERCKKIEPSISMGTVYRNLGVLASLGEILHLPMPKGPDHYDFNTSKHYHFFCRCCNAVTDVELSDIEKKIDESIKIPGYKVEGHQLIIMGVCPNCNN